MLTRLDVFEKGFVRLEDVMGDDLSIVNAAKVSYGNKDEILNEGHAGLINFLMKHRHGSPWERNDRVYYQVRCFGTLHGDDRFPRNAEERDLHGPR